MKLFKKLDIAIIVSLLALSFTPNLIFSKTLSKDYNSTYANIKVDGKVYDNIPLSSFTGEKEFEINNKNDNNIIVIKNDSIQITDANCKDKLCIKQGEISNVGESIVCLPNKVIIEIKGDESDSTSDDMILSH